MLSMHFAMNLERSLSLSPTGSFSRRAAAFARSSFVGTLVFCWRFLSRNCLKASWSEGPSLSSASSWPLAAIRGAMGCGHWAAYERVRRGSGGAAKTVGRLWAAVREDGAVRRAQRTTQAPTAAGQYPNDTPLAEPLSQRSMGPPAGRSGSVDASRATRTKASGGKALASWASGTKARPTMGR